MKMKKILAAAAASVVAVSAMSVMASADTGAWEVGYVDGWTTSNESGTPTDIGLTLDVLKAADEITLTATDDVTEWGVGVDKADGWYQTDTNEGAWISGGSITLKASDLNFAKDNFCLKICVNASGDNGKITWETKGAGAPAESTPAESTPAESAPAESAPAESAPAESAPAASTPAADDTSKGNVNTGVEGVAAVLGVAVVAAGAMVVAKKRK